MRKKVMIVAGVAIVVIGVVIGTVYYNWKQGEQVRFASKLANGFNLGNALDSTNLFQYKPDADELDYETFWKNPKISEGQLQAISDAGFKTVRIPVTWEDHLDSDYRISERWLNRVTEVVDMAISKNLYVIINTQHEKWLDLKTQNEKTANEELVAVWQQLAEHFKEYDNHLLFEGINEPRLRDSEHEWDEGTAEFRAMVNRLNQTFVDTVRSTGGNNSERYLMVQPYCGGVLGLDDFVVPKGNVIVSIHMYTPYNFCQNEKGTNEWDKDSKDSGNIQVIMEDLNNRFIDKNIPVVITEFGCMDKNNASEREEWTEYFVETASTYEIPCIWWDNGSTYKLLDRNNNNWVYPNLLKQIIK